ncbi:patatin-like phospholipase family protein [Nitrospira sp. NS4]|uniref:patatin-like phospholipase family protein n=1 Tax=Nitrospira sp. NS4 TaxID=3414498 RepID=UPI003C2DEDFB
MANGEGHLINGGIPRRVKNWVAVGLFLAWLPGCVTSPVYTLPRPKPDQPTCVRPVKPAEMLIGVAISGGGSRAALFGAAGLEALAKLPVGPPAHSLIEDVSMISSVSGGSMATSYFASQKPPREVPVLTPAGDLSEDYRTFFAAYKTTMDNDYENPLLWRNILRLRWFNPAWTARSLAEYLNAEFLKDMSFKDVMEREARGDIPRLLINTTLYNDGRRLLMTTLPQEEAQYDLLEDVHRAGSGSGRTKAVEDLIRTKWTSLQSVTPQALDLDLCPIKLAAAVATSMSFPPIIGPNTFKVEGEEQYYHAGDGGLSDNMGIESLFMAVMKQLQENPTRRALVIAFDSSFPFSVGNERLNHFPEGFTLFNYDYGRIPGIMEERALAYRLILARIMVEQGVFPDEKRFKFLHLRHIDAEWKEDLSDLPESCRKEGVELVSPPMVKQRLSSIVTRLWIESHCDRDLVTTAAAKLVEAKKAEIQKFLEQPLQ